MDLNYKKFNNFSQLHILKYEVQRKKNQLNLYCATDLIQFSECLFIQCLNLVGELNCCTYVDLNFALIKPEIGYTTKLELSEQYKKTLQKVTTRKKNTKTRPSPSLPRKKSQLEEFPPRIKIIYFPQHILKTKIESYVNDCVIMLMCPPTELGVFHSIS